MCKKIAIIHEEIHPLLNKICERIKERGFEPTLIHWTELSLDVNELSNQLLMFNSIYLDRMGENFSSYSTQIMLLGNLKKRFKDIYICNDPESYLIARNKALMAVKFAELNLPIPNTKIVYKMEQIDEFCKKTNKKYYIAKSYLGCCSEDIFPFINGDVHKNIHSVLNRDGMAIIQEFIYNPERFIWRIDVVNSQIVQCNQRFAFNDDINIPLCNGTIGGEVVFWNAIDLPKKVSELAIETVNKMGLVVAGVDILVSENKELFVAEVNPEPDITLNKLEFPYAIADYLCDINNKN